MISRKIASDLGYLIAFSWPETRDAIVRVPEHVLGFLLLGKIGPQDPYKRVRNASRNRTMALEFIYIVFA